MVAIAWTFSGSQIPFLEGRDLALGLAQVEEQLLLVGGGAHFHEAPRTQDIFLNRRADPPHSIGGQAEALLRFEALYRLHQTDIAFGDHFADRQAITAIAHGDFRNEPEMRGDETMRGGAVGMLTPAFGEHVFLLRLQHRKTTNFI